ncbi:MAG: hypothetical protein ACOYJ2_04615 [Rickettsiales bacterium]
MKKLLITTALIALTTTNAIAAECGTHHKITQDEILAVQKAWSDGIVNIGAAPDHKKAAMDLINKLYGYDIGAVLFKPTKASVVEFRDTKEEALSYFVGGQEPEDKGFALAPFTKVRFDNKGIIIDCDSALAMGNYYFTKTDGETMKVDYSFGYVEDKNGQLKINLHHSSLPYKPE